MRIPTFFIRRSLVLPAFAAALPMLAQDPCDALSILNVSYAPFTDTALQVDVSNTGDVFFSYPQFMLVDATEDTVAFEPINFFAIPIGEQVHRMDLRPDMAMPPSPFTGRLVLQYMDLDGESTCTFPVTADDLCPPPPCDTMQVYLQNIGNAGVDADFTWTITDADGNTVAEGALTLQEEGIPVDMASACLPPGGMVLHVARPFGTGGQFSFGVARGDFNTNGPTTLFVQQGDPSIPTDLPFSFYPLCVDASNGVAEHTVQQPLIALTPEGLRITSVEGRALGLLEVTDLAGRPVRRVDARTSMAFIPLSDVARGAYVLRSLDGAPPFAAQRFILP